MRQYKPKHFGHGRYGWQCATDGCIAFDYILPSPLFDYLSHPWKQDRDIIKQYKSKVEAVAAFEYSLRILKICINSEVVS